MNIAGTKLPELKDKALDGAVTSLPADVTGYVTVVAFAFKRESQADIDEWLAMAPEEFKDARRFRMYEVPMMGGGLVKLLRGTINNGMKGATPPARRRFIVPFYGDINAYARKLGMDDRGIVYVLLLDRQGVIRWSASGKATEKKSAELGARARELAGP
ncbi:MAG: hypothetical protein R6X13_10900 [bacterium]